MTLPLTIAAHIEGRIVDLSKSAAEKLEFINIGLADVKVEVLDAGTGKLSDPARAIDHVVVDEKEFYSLKLIARIQKDLVYRSAPIRSSIT